MLVTVLATTGAAFAATTFDPQQPSPTGSYLAGQSALSAMQTGAAASFLRDALEGDYDHPRVVQTALIAFAANGQIPDAANAARHMLEVDPGNELAHRVADDASRPPADRLAARYPQVCRTPTPMC